jgi:hypothetical protein
MFFIFLFFLTACQKDNSTATPAAIFDSIPISKPLIPGIIDEASGIADSKANPGYIWTEQDSGNPNDIFLLSYDASVSKKINIKNIANRDWEDIAIANGPVAGINYIYLADIGDNAQTATDYYIYRFAEPLASADTVRTIEKITFKYPDGSHDAEAILVDNNTKDIFIITKPDALSKIYRLGYPQSTSSINMAVYVGNLSIGGVVSAATSSDCNEIIIKNYTALYYWKRNAGQTTEQLLLTAPVKLGYQLEPQGEAVCFKNDNSGFFTLSEKPFFATSVSLNFYRRK